MATATTLGIEHVFVLMLENRSFDHMLGFSGIAGVTGLNGSESNRSGGRAFPVTRGADLRMPTDPAHEFGDVLLQLCGPGAVYPPGGPYPAIHNSGFAASYVAGGGADAAEAMKCYTPDQLPVLNALAAEFAVCDNWYGSMPGPTWPNRMFVHAASSAGLDHSPTTAEIVKWEAVDGFHLPNGSIFDRMNQAGVTRRLYGGDDFPMVSSLKGVHLTDIRRFSHFAADLAQASFPYQYVFIEPSYDVLHDYKSGNSQHPLADVTSGEGLIKQTYEAIRNSAVWPKSLLIVTWDEHGGFFDRAAPPEAVPPGDNPGSKYNKAGFAFDRYGPRVPAVVISPLIPKSLVDHRIYDHASVPATVESLFGLAPLTDRDRTANRLDTLITLKTARTDTPATLPSPARPAIAPLVTAAVTAVEPVSRPEESVDEGNLPAIVYAAMQCELRLWPAERPEIVARVAAIKTRQDAREFLADAKVRTLPYR